MFNLSVSAVWPDP